MYHRNVREGIPAARQRLMDKEIRKIIDRAYEGLELTKSGMYSTAVCRRRLGGGFCNKGSCVGHHQSRNGNAGYLFGQIGIACAPCEANCSFCSFAEDHTRFGTMHMDAETVIQKTKEFTYKTETSMVFT